MSNLDALPVVITETQFQTLFGQPLEWKDIVSQMCLTLPQYHIVLPERIAMFLAQVAHESGKFKYRQENLNYSAEGLLKTFPKYFTKYQVTEYSRRPEKIANRVYASRMGNGNEASGDGWKFRGRGGIQLTGKNNYKLFGDYIGKDLVTNPDYLLTVQGSMEASCWFWQSHGLNEIADSGDILQCTKVINGGTNGIEDRKALWAACKAVYGIA